MRRKSAETRQQIIDAAYTHFYQSGFINTGVDVIAEAAGITKRTLYQYFSCKDELIGVVLEHQHQLAVERIRQWADDISGEPEQMVIMLFEKFARWAGEAGWQGSGFTRAAVEFADLPGHPARTAARRQKRAVEQILSAKFDSRGLADSRTLARQILILVEGCQSLVLIHDSADYIAAARHAALALVAHQLKR